MARIQRSPLTRRLGGPSAVLLAVALAACGGGGSDDASVATALEMLASETKTLQVDFYRTGQEKRLERDIELALYRIAQEALRNVAKHAQTDRVELVLNADAEFLDLEVRDFGRGFFPAQAGISLEYGNAGDDRLALAVGDVSGKGVPAAMFSAMLDGLCYGLAAPPRHTRQPVRAVRRGRPA